MTPSQLGIVVIGRNEGERLARSLTSALASSSLFFLGGYALLFLRIHQRCRQRACTPLSPCSPSSPACLVS